MSLLVLSASDVDTISSSLSPSELQLLMARVFTLFSSASDQVHTPHRLSIPTSNHVALFMPARIGYPSLLGTTIKVVSVPKSKDDTRGLPGSTLVLDEYTGAVKAIVNARSLTALRNAAGSLLSTNIVGLRTPQTLVAFGAGNQIETHIDLHVRYFPTLRSCIIINRTINQRAESLRTLLQIRFPRVSFTFLPSSDIIPIENAVRAADLIICATSSTSPLFPSSWVRTGAHVILIGSYTPEMHEVDTYLVKRATCKERIMPRRDLNERVPRALIVDSQHACEIEAGELISAKVGSDEIVEIGQLIHTRDGFEVDEDILNVPPPSVIPGSQMEELHTYDGPITMFKSVGIGLQDVAIACAVVHKATLNNSNGGDIAVGTRIADYDSALR